MIIIKLQIYVNKLTKLNILHKNCLQKTSPYYNFFLVIVVCIFLFLFLCNFYTGIDF